MKKLARMIILGMFAGVLAGYSANCSSTSTGACAAGDCLPACSDGILTPPETDIDCGGDICKDCNLNQKCQVGTDCVTGFCVSGICSESPGTAGCTNGSKDGNEADADCGGPCAPCASGKTCIVSNDCASSYCAGGRCKDPTCTDGVKNGSESDLDCGGVCPVCALGKGCTANSDCAPLLCDSGKCGLGTGGDGPLNIVTGTNQVINAVASPATGSQGGTTLTLISATGFASGQTLFIHQTQGAGAGNQEMNRITAINGTAVTLGSPLQRTYSQGAQAVVVPQYTTVDLAAGATLAAPAWNGTQGGILVFQANGNVNISGTVTMNGRGFRGGGDAASCFPGTPGCIIKNGRFGESEVGVSTFSLQDTSGYGTSSGSGGGGGTHGQDCAAGGGGSHATAGQRGVDGSLGNCIENGKHGGGLPGSMIGSPDLSQTIFLGGGGGEGGPDEDGRHPGEGGNGGGLIIMTGSTLTVSATGIVSASGSNGGTGATSIAGCAGSGAGMGNGGAGAGGAIRLFSAGATDLNTGRVVALGGTGGSGGACAAAGNGGVGRIHVRAGITPVGTTNPAAYSN